MTGLAAAVVVALFGTLVAVIPANAATPTGLVVLDPDDNYSHANWGGQQFSELPITYAISQTVKTDLEKLCDTSVVITRDASQNFVSRSARAAQMVHADVSLTISLNNLNGTPWGTAADGGASSFASPYANDVALAQKTLDEWTRFTGRRDQAGVSQGGTNGTNYPYPEFAGLPGTYAQTFFGFMDHNFDWPAISGTYQSVQYGYQVDAIVSAIGKQLQEQGISCGDASKGQTAFPAAPTAAELAALFSLGFANWMRYGSDPVNFSTGNFLQSNTLFTVSGPGGTNTPITLSYNSLDKRSGMFAAGWADGLVSKSQTYADGSVLISGPDGATTAFTKQADGTYSPAQPGIFTTLARTADHTLVLTAPDGSTQTFTEDVYTGAGVETASTDRAGHAWAYEYGTTSFVIPPTPNPWPVAPDGTSAGSGSPARTITSFGPLKTITVPGGQVITFTSDDQGRVTSVSQPGGATWTLGYAASTKPAPTTPPDPDVAPAVPGVLASVTDPLGNVTKYGYDSSDRMTTVTAPDGVTYVSNTYDDAGRVVKQANGDGNVTTITYGDNQTTYTDTTGAKTVFSIDAQGRVTKVVTPKGNQISTGYHDWQTTSSTDADGNTTKYAYDSAGRLTKTTTADGGATTLLYNNQGDVTASTLPDGRTTTYTVDAQGRTTAVAGPNGAHWQQSFDNAGNLVSRTDPNSNTTQYGYDGRGDLTTVTDALGGVTTLAYDLAGRVTQVTDPDGHQNTYTYDLVGDLTSMTDGAGATTTYTYQSDGKVETITDPRGGVTTYTYNKGLNVATVTDPTGATTSYAYDSEYRLTAATDPDGGVTKYAYDGEGLVTSITDPDGHITTKTYDAAQNLTSITDPNGAVTKVSYDNMNRPASVTDAKGGITAFSYDLTGRLTKTTDALGRKTAYSYNDQNQVVTVTDPKGSVTKYGYDIAGNQTSSTDPTGRATAYSFDALDRVIASVDPAGAKTTYAYDPAGNLTAVVDPNGHSSTYSYDGANHLTTATDGAGDKTKYAYDKSGNVTGITDPRGGTINFSYNGNNQLTQRTDQAQAVTKYQYTAAGVLKSMIDPTGVSTAYSHDAAGLLTQVVQGAAPGAAGNADTNVTTKYSYDPANRLTQVTDPLGHTTGYAYDPTGNVTSVTDPLGNIRKYGYDAAGQETSSTLPDGKTTTYSYDGAGHLTGTLPDGATPASGSAISYTYDGAGRLTGMKDTTGTSSWTFTQAGQVSSTTTGAGKTLAYAYDPAGNRTSLTYPDGSKVSYGLDAANRVTGVTDSTGTVGYSYDRSGDLTGITRPNHTTSTYSYDPTGRVTGITHTGSTPGVESAAPQAAVPATPAPAAPSPTGVATSTPTPSAAATVVPSPAPTTPAPQATVPATPTPSPSPSSTKSQTPLSAVTNTVTGLVCGVLPICPDTALTAADGLPMTLGYSYDKSGRVTHSTQASATKTLSTDYSYDKLGRLTGSTRTDGANSTYGYDAAGNRVSGTDVDRLTGNILTYQATYSATNQLLTQTQTPPRAQGLLGAIVGTVTTTNTWNVDGEQTKSVKNTIVQGSILGLITLTATRTETTTNTYTFDAKLATSTKTGAGSSKLVTSYNYDGLGRTASETLPDQGAEDHLSAALKKLLTGVGCGTGGTVPGCEPGTSGDTPFAGNQATITNDGATPVSWSTGTSSAGTTINLVQGPEGADHQTTITTGDGKTTTSAAWLYLDAQGTVRATADSTGATQTASSYTDFGSPEPAAGVPFGVDLTAAVSLTPVQLSLSLGITGGTIPGTTTATPVGYTGQQVNPDAGLLQFRARTYQPGQAQWLTRDTNPGDPTDPVTQNLYGYVNDDPTTMVDRDGHAGMLCTGGSCGKSLPKLLSPSQVVNVFGTGSQNSCSGSNPKPPCKAQPTKAPKQDSPKSGSGHYKGAPPPGALWNQLWNQELDIAGQFYSGIGEGLFGIGKFFLWDATPIGASIKVVNSIGCLANYSSCEAQQQAASAPWQKDFWGTAEKTFIQPTLDDFANHPAHAIGKLLPDVAIFAIPGGGLVKGARVAEEAGSAAAGTAALDALSPAVRATVEDAIARAASGKVRFPGHDGKVYQNSDGQLPAGGNYTEWTAAQSGAKRGADRIIIEGDPANPNAIYYWDHVNPPVWIGP